jgi:teichoic acid transport system permease protein
MRCITRHASINDAQPLSALRSRGHDLPGPRRATHVLLALVKADMRARYGRGAMRYVKWLLDPYALVGVYLLLMVFVLDRSGTAPGLAIACSVVPFQLIMATTINAMEAITTRRSIILNMAFPRLLIPLSSVFTETAAASGSLSLLALMMVVYGIAPTASMLLLPLVIAVTILLAVGVAYPAAIFGLWFRDIRSFATSFVRTLYFLAPGLIVLEDIGGLTRTLVMLNPLTGLFESYRDVLLFGRTPDVWELAYPAIVALLLLVIFVPLYRSEQRQFAKVVE